MIVFLMHVFVLLFGLYYVMRYVKLYAIYDWFKVG